MNKLLLCFSLIGITIVPAFSQVLDTQKLDSLFNALAKNDLYYGSLCISHKNVVIYTNGIQIFKKDAPREPQHIKYKIASVTKIFTACLVLKAIEEKKLSFNTKLATYFPKIKNANRINIQQLLYHRSGIHNFTSDSSFFSWNTTFQSSTDIVRKIACFEPDFEPNAKASYSNSNYVLLGYILERIYKKPYQTLLKIKIVDPINLQSTYFGSHNLKQKDTLNCYQFNSNRWQKQIQTDLSIPAAAGAIISSPYDLTVFISKLFSYNIISKQSLQKMTDLKDGFGMGIFKDQFESITYWGHDGTIDNFASRVAYLPAEQLSFALISNARKIDNDTVMEKVLSCLPIKKTIFEKLK